MRLLRSRRASSSRNAAFETTICPCDYLRRRRGSAPGTLSSPRVSPDGHRMAVIRRVQGNTDLWLLDGARTTRFTFDTVDDAYTIWSPDGMRIVFRSSASGRGALYQKLTNGTGVEERLVGGDQVRTPTAGRRMVAS